MKPVTKTILITAGIALLAGAAFAVKKVKMLQAVFDRMTIKPQNISGTKIGLMQLDFKLDIKITNPTPEAFSVSGASLAILKSIRLYRKGKFLGKADLNLRELEIQPRSSYVLKHIPFSVTAAAVLENLMTIETLSPSELSIVAIVEVLGSEYEITG